MAVSACATELVLVQKSEKVCCLCNLTTPILPSVSADWFSSHDTSGHRQPGCQTVCSLWTTCHSVGRHRTGSYDHYWRCLFLWCKGLRREVGSFYQRKLPLFAERIWLLAQLVYSLTRLYMDFLETWPCLLLSMPVTLRGSSDLDLTFLSLAPCINPMQSDQTWRIVSIHMFLHNLRGPPLLQGHLIRTWAFSAAALILDFTPQEIPLTPLSQISQHLLKTNIFCRSASKHCIPEL